MARLSPAHYGYNHQDIVTAYAMVSLLLPRSRIHKIVVEQKATADDRFDDLELVSEVRRRAQLKAHTVPGRLLSIADLKTNAIEFRIDRASQSVSNAPKPADLYTLFTTYLPANDLLQYLDEDQSAPQLLSGIETHRYRLSLHRIWPAGQEAIWPLLTSLGREAVANFVRLFVIEAGCPTSSGDLRAPGPFEQALLAILRDSVGLGVYPNHNRDLADAAAHLIHGARLARESSRTVGEDDVIKTLALRIDYGRVGEEFPVNVKNVVQRSDVMDEIIQRLAYSSRLAITGAPGVGKSWLVQQLRSHMANEGWVVAAHFCFVGLFDNNQYPRASILPTFGSIIAELYDADRSLLSNSVPRFAAGPNELEQLLWDGARANRHRHIAIIVDGLDHVDRLPGRAPHATAAEIVQELATLTIPDGVAIIVVSQPGDHLIPFLALGSEYSFARWPDERIREIVQRSEIQQALSVNGLESETEGIVRTIVDKAAGNPLFATYLTRTAASIARQETTVATADIAAYLISAPTFDPDLERYYGWLVEGLAKDTGVMWVAEILSLLDFAVTSDELKQIRPEFQTHVSSVLARLNPVLADDVAHGGVRIYHESFQRYIRRRLDGNPETIASILTPVIAWLESRSFFKDVRAFRSLFSLLTTAGRESEIPSRVTEDFIVLSAANMQAGEAVMANIATAGTVAASLQDWPSLSRLLEISRACDYLYEWRFRVEHDVAQEYGLAYAEIFGVQPLADRLLYDGHCTFLPTPGLLLCRLCDLKGTIPAWKEYISAHEQERTSDNHVPGGDSDTATANARLVGQLRLLGRDKSIQSCIGWLCKSERSPLHPHDIAVELASMYGADALKAVIESCPAGPSRAWAQLALGELSGDPKVAKAQAEAAVRDGIPIDGWQACFAAGASAAVFPRQSVDLQKLTEEVLSEGIEFQPERLQLWLTEIDFLVQASALDEIRAIEVRIVPDSWFHKWVFFCLVLAGRKAHPDAVLESLNRLAEDVEVFKGKPRACDLYQLHDEIRESFRRMLANLDSDRWVKAVRTLSKISRATSSWVMGSRSGPLPLDAMFDLCLETGDTSEKREAASDVAAELLGPKTRSREFYDTHARDNFLLARLHMASGREELAAAVWSEACVFLMGYGFRKDPTVYEVLNSLATLGRGDTLQTRECIKRMQPIVEGVLVHTDGKGTRRAIHEWIDIAGGMHPAGALSFLARREIGRLPSYGDLDHAISGALAALSDQVGTVQLAIGWLAAGSDAQGDIAQAIETCERLFALGEAGMCVWQTVVASLEGDVVGPHSVLRSLATISAKRLRISEPEIESATLHENEDLSSRYDPPDKKTLSEKLVPSLFVATSSPLQIVGAVRKWRSTRLGTWDADRVVNAIGWRLQEFIEDGDVAAAEMIIRRLARDASWTDRDGILADLAEGLAIRGYQKLAALAYALAFTSGRDGWGHFGGPMKLALTAIQLDRDLAWATIGEELAGILACGGCTFTTKCLVELLVEDGQVQQALSSWKEACDVITARLPHTGPADQIDVEYQSDTPDASFTLAAAIFSRINHFFVHEKRIAVAAAALLARYEPLVFSSGLRFAVENEAPPWTLVTLLHALYAFETEPYDATHASLDVLRATASGELVSARTLARALLRRAGVEMPIAPPTVLVSFPSIAEDRASDLTKMIGKRRFRKIERLWPEFEQYALEQIDVVYRSEDLRQRMRRAMDRLRLRRKGRNLQIWYPIDEEMERALQITGAAVRSSLFQRGVIDPSVEDQVGMHLLGDIETMVRLVLSRIVRPKYAGKTIRHALGTYSDEPFAIDDGAYEQWIVAGFREVSSKLGTFSSIDARTSTYSGVVFDNEANCNDKVPFGRGDVRAWNAGISTISWNSDLRGPLCGLQRFADCFGVSDVFIPHPAIVDLGGLHAPSFYRGLTLVDGHGKPAVACRTWRSRLIGGQYLEDREHRVEGFDLLVRPDVFAAVCEIALKPPKLVTVVSEIKGEDDE